MDENVCPSVFLALPIALISLACPLFFRCLRIIKPMSLFLLIVLFSVLKSFDL